MEFLRTELDDALLIRSEAHADDRGSFARMRCAREFAEHGLPADFVQTNLSFNKAAGTFRGLHFQIPPSREGKLVRCIVGAIDDIIVDLRPNSPTFLQHQWFRLMSETLEALFVPPGFAHGFLTVENDSTVLYEMSDYYAPALSRGLRWDDPALDIRIPGEIRVINQRDTEFTDLQTNSLECFRVAKA